MRERLSVKQKGRGVILGIYPFYRVEEVKASNSLESGRRVFHE